MGSLQYEFALTGGGMESGFNNPAIEHFVGNPSYYLARESIQNILDVKISNPAIAKFSPFTIRAHDIPDYKELLYIINCCGNYDKTNPKALEFYLNASRSLANNAYLHVLRIDDYNTSGMDGDDDDRKGNYHKFMRSFGNSSKILGSGGSFGLGKAAYYAASNFRMIFVSSTYEEKDEQKCMYQGKLLLNSFEKNGQVFQGDGSFGLPGQRAVRDPNLIPEFFKRKEKGTSVFIVGFSESHVWEEKILRAVLENFWPAIVDGRLEVQIGDLELSMSTIEEIIKSKYSLEDPDKQNEPNPLPYFLAYTEAEGDYIYERELETLGKVKLYTLIGEGLPDKTAYARSAGMIVQKNGRYYCSKSHASFFYCLNKEGSEILKRMENPRHDEWRAKNWIKSDGKPDPNSSATEKDLSKFIKEAHERFGSDTVKDSIHIPNLEQYLFLPADDEDDLDTKMEGQGTQFVDVSDEETGSETGALESELAKKPQSIKPIKIPNQEMPVTEGEGDLDTFDRGAGGKGDLTSGVPVQPDEEGEIKRVALPVEFRSFFPADAEGKHVLRLSNVASENATVEIYGVTEDGYLPLTIEVAKNSQGKNLEVSENKIVKLVIDGSEIITIKFHEKGKYSLNVRAYED